MTGKTENCRYVSIPGNEQDIGKIVDVAITDANRHFLKGKLLELD